jgi:HEAT repeat protein
MEHGGWSRKYPGYAGGFLREWLARWLGVGKARRLRAGTRAEALTAAYRQKLVTELHSLKTLDVAKLLDLETFYVPLQVREYNGREESTGHVREGEVVERKGSVGDLCPSMSPEEALLQFRHLTVLGDPGAGKTTMLRYLTLLAAQGRLANLPDFPILIPLGRFAAVPQVTLLDFVISEVEARYSFPEPRPDDSTGSLHWPAEGLRPDGSAGPPRGPAEELRPDGSTGSPRGPAEGLRPYLEERLEEGSVLFLLDGLDEASGEQFVGGRSQEAEATYRHVLGQINVLAARYPNCPIVVTATTSFGRGNWKGLLAATFRTVEVLGFNRCDIQRFIVNWFGAGSDRARDLQDALSQNPRMWTLAANPLLLSLMAFAFERGEELPEGREGLYRRGAELLFREEGGSPDDSTSSSRPFDGVQGRRLVEGEEHRDLKRTYSLTIEHKRSLLEEVALHFHLRRVLLFPRDELRKVIASYLPTVPSPALSKARPEPSRRGEDLSKSNDERALSDIPAEQVPTVLEAISSQRGLLREQVGGWYGFPHPTWQEYFAAAAISRRASNNEPFEWVLEGLHDPWWEGTVLFLAGVLEDATPFLEGILAQEEDIFHSNLLLAGRCLAMCEHKSPLRVEGVGLDIIEGLKKLLEGEYHRLLQRQAVSVLAEIGGGAVVSFFVALLRRGEIDLGVLAEVAKILGSLHDKSVVPDLLAFLTDEELDPSVRGNIAEAMDSLGDESVILPLLALLPDETVDPSVRGRVIEALVTLGGDSVVSPLLAFLPDEGIEPHVRGRISEALLSLPPFPTLHPPVISQLLSLLPDEKIHPSVRRGIAEAAGSWGDESAVPDLLAFLSDEKLEPSVRGKAAEALGALGAESAVPPLLAILGDEKVDYSVRMMVADALSVLGDESVSSQLLALLPDENIDPDVRASIAGALGVLGEKSVVPQLLSLLPDERIDPAVRWRIVDALSSLGDKTIIPHLRAFLPDEKIDSSVRWMVAEALEALAEEPTESAEWRMEEGLGSLNDRSRVPQLLTLLKNERIAPSVSGRLIEALGSLGDDRATVEGLAALLDREDIAPRVYEALFHVSRRAGMRVFARKGRGYEVRPVAGVYPEQSLS